MTKDDLDNLDNWRIAMDDRSRPSADQQEARVNFYQYLYNNWSDVSKLTRVGLDPNVVKTL